MKELEQWLINNIQDESLGWSVLHKLNEAKVPLGKWKIVMLEREHTDRDLPFTFNPGYFNFDGENDKSVVNELMTMIRNVAMFVRNNPIALCNLFIFLNRVSCKKEDYLPSIFLDDLETEEVKELTGQYVKQINILYKNPRLKQKQPETTWEWVALFTSAQYMSTINDPFEQFNVLTSRLSKDKRTSELEWILKLAPLARARAIDFWGIDIKATESEIIETINKNRSEASFIAAYLTELLPHENTPNWITKKVVELLFVKHWKIAGCFLLQSTYGMPFRVKNEKLNDVIKPLYSEILSDYFVKGLIEAESNILEEMIWPRDFISLMNWLYGEQISPLSILETHKNNFARAIVNVLNGFIKAVPEILSSDNKQSGVEFYSLNNQQYQLTFPSLLIFLINNEIEREKFEKLFFEVREMYYGSWDAQRLAEEYTEFIILILLGLVNIENMSEKELNSYNKMLDKFIETLWYSFILKCENSEYIWNPNYAFDIQFHNYTKYLINEKLKALKSITEYAIQYEKLYNTFSHYKTAEWPFERVK